MEFDLTDRQQHWRDRVRDFIEKNARPRMGDYKAKQAEGGRWKVLQVVEEEKAMIKVQAPNMAAAVCRRVTGWRKLGRINAPCVSPMVRMKSTRAPSRG